MIVVVFLAYFLQSETTITLHIVVSISIRKLPVDNIITNGSFNNAHTRRKKIETCTRSMLNSM